MQTVHPIEAPEERRRHSGKLEGGRLEERAHCAG
jgi:hypothetical protein